MTHSPAVADPGWPCGKPVKLARVMHNASTMNQGGFRDTLAVNAEIGAGVVAGGIGEVRIIAHASGRFSAALAIMTGGVQRFREAYRRTVGSYRAWAMWRCLLTWLAVSVMALTATDRRRW